MAQVNKSAWASAFADGDDLDGSVLITHLDAIADAANDVETDQLDLTSCKVFEIGAANRKIIYGVDTGDINGVATLTGTITFTTDGVDSPSAFASATDLIPTISLGHSSSEILLISVTGLTTTTLSWKVWTAGGAATGGSTPVNIYFQVMGRSA